MDQRSAIEDMTMRGVVVPATPGLRALYAEAFERFGVRALSSSRPVASPTVADFLAITETLRVEGGVAGGLRCRSSRTAVPLFSLQSRILRLLADHRSPESFVAVAIPLTRTGLRYSSDIDVFHDREQALPASGQ